MMAGVALRRRRYSPLERYVNDDMVFNAISAFEPFTIVISRPYYARCSSPAMARDAISAAPARSLGGA